LSTTNIRARKARTGNEQPPRISCCRSTSYAPRGQSVQIADRTGCRTGPSSATKTWPSPPPLSNPRAASSSL